MMEIRKLRNTNAYVIGKDHERKKIVCQDRTYFKVANGAYAISLSDGAGSKRLSHFGAETTVSFTSEYFSKKFDETYNCIIDVQNGDKLRNLKSEFTDALKERMECLVVKNHNTTRDDFLCTMEFVIVKGNKYIAGHCGDGVIAILRYFNGNESLDVLSFPENGEAANITYFVNSENGSEHIRLYAGSMENVKGFVLMSDGPEEVFYNSKSKEMNITTSVFFDAISGVSEAASHSFFERFLKEKVAAYSHDDLSVNVLTYDEYDSTKSNEKDFESDFFEEVYPNQITRESAYCFTIDNSVVGLGSPLFGQDVLDYISKEYGI